MSDPGFYTRREFLRTTLLGGAMTWTLPAFLQLTLEEMAAAADGALLQPTTGKDGPILVVIQLAGGNDGLNTLVPYTNDLYYKARPQLAVRKEHCLPLTDTMGLHTSLRGLKTLYDKGHLAILQGVGYPNPNRSHFRSMEIWQTASDADQTETRGWIGTYFDNQCQGMDASVGIAMGDQLPQAFSARMPKGVTFAGAEQFRTLAGGSDFMEPIVGGFGDTSADNAGDSIGGLGSSPGSSLHPLDYLEKVALDAKVATEQISSILNRKRGRKSYPVTPLARQLSTIAQLIAGEMSTRIYYVSQGGFDTHANQKNTHANLLSRFGDALRVFVEDLEEQGNLDRVTVLCFSEFGRRVKENASGGTDHGAAAPLFLVGGGLKAGIHGDDPGLRTADLVSGDIRHQTDFRSVYATILEKHLAAPSRAILRGSFPLLDVYT